MSGNPAWLVALFGPALLAIVSAALDRDARRVRAMAVGCALVCSAAAMTATLLPALTGLAEQAGASALRLDALSQILLPLPPLLWLITVAVTPQAQLDRAGLGRTAAAAGACMLGFLTEWPALLAACWLLSSAVFLWGCSRGANPRTIRVLAVYHALGALLFGAGLVLCAIGELAAAGRWLIVAAVLLRKGIVPFHAWIPEAFDAARIGPTVLFSAPQLGTYVAATLVLPHASAELLRVVALLALGTSVYGAALALVQVEARRALGYLFVSQSALVLAGLDCTSGEAVTGAVVLWLASALAFTGLARTVLCLEARRGRLRLTEHHGGFDQMPLLAASFLLFGLASSGFPGTLGFVVQELLVHGAVQSFPAMGFLTIAAASLTALAVLRMYFSLFCGRPGGWVALSLRRRESVVFAGIALVLVLAGMVPGPVVRPCVRASELLLVRAGARAHAPGQPALPAVAPPRAEEPLAR
ncbi:MAG: hypothetical protein KatS3mg102_1397 [Planctomycetota bacterium]|nr:MAG: hypothetical protein KatS3mg102_1397 [Planctomycetota bacterium]